METTSTTNSATRGIITALGAGSGIDMVALASDLATAQFAGRIDRLAARSEKLEAQISAASNLKSMLLSLSSSLGERVRVGDLSRQPSLDNAAVASASLSGTRQPSGTFSLEVMALAKSQSLASAAFASPTATTGSGTLTLRFGTVSGASFTADAARDPVDITIAAGSTLTQIAAAINGAGAGVTAYVANTVDGAQLVFKGAQGAANGFVIEATEDSLDPGLSALAWTPASTTGALLDTAQDASVKIDGLTVASPTNRLVDAIPGVTLDLKATNIGSPTTVRFADPGAAITEAMTDLTNALNEIATELKAATDPASGDLARDPGARALLRQFSQLAGTVIMPGASADSARTLADLGLKTQRDGTFALDPARLSATLARDPEGVAAMFTTGLFGIYATIDSISRKAGTVGDPGSLGGSLSRYNRQLSEVTEDQAEIAEKQEELRARLQTRFAGADSRVSASQSTLAFLKNQIAAWNSSDNQ
jgi:flagellar hook-associated protein 2